MKKFNIARKAESLERALDQWGVDYERYFSKSSRSRYVRGRQWAVRIADHPLKTGRRNGERLFMIGPHKGADSMSINDAIVFIAFAARIEPPKHLRGQYKGFIAKRRKARPEGSREAIGDHIPEALFPATMQTAFKQ